MATLVAVSERDGMPPRRSRRATSVLPAVKRALLSAALAAVVAAAGVAHGATPAAALQSTPTDVIANNPALMRHAIAVGRTVYRSACVACHGANLKGVAGKHAPDLSDRATLFGSDDVDAEVDQIHPSDIETTIRYGIRSGHAKTRELAVMPSFAGRVANQQGGYPILSQDDIGSLTDYLLSLQKRKADPARVERGKVLFADKGGCFDCHGRDAKGNPAIGAPDLTSMKYLYGSSRKEIMASIREGRQGFMPAFEGTLSDAQIKSAAYYLFSVREHAK